MQIQKCDTICQLLAAGRWFSPGTPGSSTNKTDHHNTTEILLKVAFIFNSIDYWYAQFTPQGS
jgi:hypothetical protein